MIPIKKANSKDAGLLAELGAKSFIESHGHSASADDISEFVKSKFNVNTLTAELNDPSNIYHIIYKDSKPAGYSKIIFNSAHADIKSPNTTKLERIFLLKELYGSSLGVQLFQFVLSLSKENGQTGMWLYVWTENKRAINFYIKNGFRIIGDYEYKISERHSNPNYQMLLEY